MKKCVLAMREKGDGGGGVLEAHAIFFAKQAGDFFGVVATFALDFIDFGVDKGAVPPALYEGEDEAFFSVAPCAFGEVAVEEVGKRPPEQRLAGIAVFLPPLAAGLGVDHAAFIGLCCSSESDFDVDQVGGLSDCVVDMFVAEP